MSAISVLTSPGLSAAPTAKPESSAVPQGSGSGAAQAAPGSSLTYPNPKFAIDPLSNKVVVEFRDSSGFITQQIPPKDVVRAYQLTGASTVPSSKNSGGAAA